MVRPDLAERGWPVFEISAATREGLTELSYALAAEVERYRASLPPTGADPDRAAAGRRWTTAGSPSSATRTTRTRSSSAASGRSGG